MGGGGRAILLDMARKTRDQLETELEIALLAHDELLGQRDEKQEQIGVLLDRIRELEKQTTPLRRVREKPYASDSPTNRQTVHEIFFVDEDERYGPPEQEVMGLSMVEDRVFIALGLYEESATDQSFVRVANFCIHVDTLIDAIAFMRRNAW